MSLEAVFDKTKARPLKELMAESKAKKAAASDGNLSSEDYKKDKLKLAAAILSGDDEFISALNRVGYVSDNKNDETLMKLGEDALEILSKDKPSEYMGHREYVKMYPRTERQRVEAAKQVMKYLSAKIPAEVENKLPLVKNLTDAENAYLIKYMKYTPTDSVMVLRGDLSKDSPSTLKMYRKFYGKKVLSLPYDTTYIYHDKTNKQLSARSEPENPIY